MTNPTHDLAAEALERLALFLRTGKMPARCAFCRSVYEDAGPGPESVAEHVKTCPEHPMRAVEAELARVQERLRFFQPKCAQCDAPLEVHPYQCKLWGLCDKCVGDVDAGDPREPAPDLTVLDVPIGGKVDLSHVKTRYVSVRVTAEPTTTGSIEVHPADFAQPTCPGCGHVGCAINSEGCAAGQCACEALKRPDPNTWKPGSDFPLGETIGPARSRTPDAAPLPELDTIAGAVLATVCPFCHGARHDPDPEKNAGMCPEIPF